jgi:hypothetical protein
MEAGTIREILGSQHRVGFSGRMEFSGDQLSLRVWMVRGEIAHAQCGTGISGWQAIETSASRRVSSHFMVEDELPPARTVRLETASLVRALKHFEGAPVTPGPYSPVPLHTRLEERYSSLKCRMSGLVGFEAHVKSIAECAEQNFEALAEVPRDPEDGDRVIIEQTPRQSRWEFRHRDRRLVLIGEAGLMTGDLLWAGEQLRKELLQIEQEEGEEYE